jgi:3-phosphoglycerate kinase
MFIVNPPQEVKVAIQEQAADDLDKDQGILDVDYLEFNDLEVDELEESEEDLEYSALDIDALNVNLLVDVLDVIEALDRKVRGSGSSGEGSGSIGTFKVEGAKLGLNTGSQYNVFIEDEKLIFFRDVNGIIEIAFDSGSNVYLQTIVEGYEGVILIGDGDDSQIFINQSN